MSEGEAEKKNIAKLDFTINDAINSLDLVDKKLKSIAETSGKFSMQISQNISKGITVNVNADDLKKNLLDVEKMTKASRESITKNTIKEAQKNQNAINQIAFKGEEARKTAAYKSMLKQEEYNNRIAKSTESLYDKITQYAKTYIIYQGFNQLKQAISETIDEMVQLEYRMVEIDRVLNESSLDIDNYRDKLIKLAYDYGNSFDNVSDITLRLAKAGFDSQEAIALTEKTLLALNTAELNATQATDDMVAVMAQWGLMTGNATQEAKEYGEIIDKINKVADRFPTTSEDIMNALKKVSSAFNLAGASINETIATIVAAEKASQRGGKVIGTALSNIIQQLKAEKKLDLAEQLGLNFYEDEAKTKFKPIMEIFQEMSDRMASLKEQGKESTVEMQNLLEMFTVFRRNIGASLLGEMSGGEESTYMQVLNTTLTATGYSLQENEKYLKTAKAAQEQFNAELLKFKKDVWDNGLEDAFRNLLSIGKDVINGINFLIKNIGLLPTAIAAVTLAFSLLNKNLRVSEWLKMADAIKKVRIAFKESEAGTINYNKALKGTNETFQTYIKTVGKENATMKGYIQYLKKSTVETMLLTAKTVILQATISLGLTAAITLITTSIEKWINAEENATKALKENKQAAEDNANKLKTERETLEDLTKQLNETIEKYKELEETDGDKTETTTKLYELQMQINEALVGTGKQINVINESTDEQGKKVQEINKQYEEQLSWLKAIAYEKKKQEVEALKEAMEYAKTLRTPYTESVGEKIDATMSGKWDSVNKKIKELNIDMMEYVTKLDSYSNGLKGFFDTLNEAGGINLNEIFGRSTYEEQIEILNSLKNKFKENGDSGSEAYNQIYSVLKILNEKQEAVTEATDKYKNALSELYAMSGKVDTFNSFLNTIAGNYNLEGPNKLIEDLKQINQEFSDGVINIEQYFDKIQEKISQIDFSKEGKELEAYQAIFAATTSSLAETVESLIEGYSTGAMGFTDYAKGIKEAGENSLELFAKQNNLIREQNGLWSGGSEEINAYANGLQTIQDELNSFSDLLTTIGDKYDYIAEHANAAGEAMFTVDDIGTTSYNELANNMAMSLQKMKNDNEEAYSAITNAVFKSMGKNANEVENADQYITEALNGNAQALNAALNESANQVSLSTSKVTASMGKVLTELGKAISEFSYNITATPFLSGNLSDLGIKLDENGNLKINLPKFGFDITGSGGSSVKELGTALSTFGTELADLGANEFKYTTLKSATKPYVSTSGNGGTSNYGSSGGGSSSSYYKNKQEDDEEDTYKERLNNFKNYITEKERLEQRWVKKQKELGLLSNDDYLYITEQRINRYKKYLDELAKVTWMKDEDKLALEKTYTEKIEDLQLDYFKYLEDKLNDEIDNLKKANEEKIDLIKEEANARIEALKAVESENDRIRRKEEYEKKRAEHLEDISYWEQRTGREAQEALKEARAKLKELDEEWEQQLEDWSIDDQIKAIEEERDAQVQAIQDTQEAEINSMKAIYDEKVKLFTESGQIIYENSVIQSQNLYNQYKTNFIDPIKADLEDINKVVVAQTTQETPTQQYETYLIKSGDTLSAIARKFNTTVDKIMTANPYIKNKNLIYAGKTLQIPKFHEGGIVGGHKEAFALLKPDEVILKPEWAEGINKLVKMVRNNENPITNNSTVIEVSGDLVRIDAKLNNKTDAEYLTRRVEQMLKDKFNIKK